MPSTASFTPLSTPASIRLLDIDPWSKGNSLICTFHELDLEGNTGPSSFTALSCRWGDEAGSQEITLNGQPVVVRRNLYDFMLHAKREGWVNDLWIDALCIDQDNVRERNRQVAMMGHIFSRAVRVLVWLGPLGKVESQGLLDFSEWCGDLNDISSDASADGDKRQYRWERLSDSCRRGMVRVLQNPYWMRKWIIQEIYLAGLTAEIVTCHWTPTIPIVHIARGVSKILSGFFMESTAYKPPWEYRMGDRSAWFLPDRNPDIGLAGADAETIRDANELWAFRRFIGYDPDEGRFRYLSATGLPRFWETLEETTMTYKPQHLLSLMDAFRRHPCTVQHDNVYALLGLANSKSGSIRVDYSCAVEDLARAVWAATKDNLEGHELDHCILYTLQIRDRESFSLEAPGSMDKILSRLQRLWRT